MLIIQHITQTTINRVLVHTHGDKSRTLTRISCCYSPDGEAYLAELSKVTQLRSKCHKSYRAAFTRVGKHPGSPRFGGGTCYAPGTISLSGPHRALSLRGAGGLQKALADGENVPSHRHNSRDVSHVGGRLSTAGERVHLIHEETLRVGARSRTGPGGVWNV